MFRARRLILVAAVALAIGGVVVTVAGRNSSPASGDQASNNTDERASSRSTTTSSTSTSTTTTTTTTLPTTTAAPLPPAPPPGTGPAPNTPGGITVGALPRTKGPVPLVARIPTLDPVVFVTMDDGMVQNPAIFDFIRDNKIPVTLFLNTTFVRKNPDYFRQFQTLGATIQAHTARHPDLRKLSPGDQAAVTCELQGPFAETFGAAPTLFRPPYGNWTPASLDASPGCGIKAQVLWKATMNNGQIQLQDSSLKAGDIILMHFRDDTVANLQYLMQLLPTLGLRPANLLEYINAAPPS